MPQRCKYTVSHNSFTPSAKACRRANTLRSRGRGGGWNSLPVDRVRPWIGQAASGGGGALGWQDRSSLSVVAAAAALSDPSASLSIPTSTSSRQGPADRLGSRPLYSSVGGKPFLCQSLRRSNKQTQRTKNSLGKCSKTSVTENFLDRE